MPGSRYEILEGEVFYVSPADEPHEEDGRDGAYFEPVVERHVRGRREVDDAVDIVRGAYVDTIREREERGGHAADEHDGGNLALERARDHGDDSAGLLATRAHDASLLDSSSFARARSRARPTRRASMSARYSWSAGSSAAARGTLR